MDKRIQLRIKDQIAVLSFNTPEKYNAFDLDMMNTFKDHLIMIARNDVIRGVIITGEGKAFSTGGATLSLE